MYLMDEGKKINPCFTSQQIKVQVKKSITMSKELN